MHQNPERLARVKLMGACLPPQGIHSLLNEAGIELLLDQPQDPQVAAAATEYFGVLHDSTDAAQLKALQQPEETPTSRLLPVGAILFASRTHLRTKYGDPELVDGPLAPANLEVAQNVQLGIQLVEAKVSGTYASDLAL
jgi:hypothetical protein